MLRVKDTGGVQRVIVGVKVRDTSTLHTILNVFARDGSALRTVFSSFGGGAGISASPTSVSGYGYSASTITISTGSTTVTVTGGVPPYTYAWVGPGGAWSAINPTSATTSFRRSGVSVGTSYSTTFTCTATDANGHTSSVSVDASVENYYTP